MTSPERLTSHGEGVEQGASLERRLRDYATNGCRSWIGIEAVFREAADAIKAKDDALKPFAELADEAEPYGDFAYVYLANAIALSDCQVARAALSNNSHTTGEH